MVNVLLCICELQDVNFFIYLILISCFVEDKLISVYPAKNIVFYFVFAYFFLVFKHFNFESVERFNF